MKDRESAQDRFNKANFLFAGKGKIKDAYPEIDTIKVEVTERGKGVREGLDKSYYTKDTMREYGDCSNSFCSRGGFRLGELVRDMVRNKETSKDVVTFCIGKEGSPQLRRTRGSCSTRFTIKIEISYLAAG